MNAYSMNMRTTVLNKFWKKHISDKNGLRSDMPPCVQRPTAVPKATFSFAMAVMDKENWVRSNLAANNGFIQKPFFVMDEGFL